MATSADALIGGLLQQPGLIGQAFQQAQQQADQHAQAGINDQLGQQQVQQNQIALAAQAQAAQQQQAYDQWWKRYTANPTGEMLQQGIAQFPSRWKEIQDQKAALEGTARQSQDIQLGQAWHAATNGRADLVAGYMQNVIDAEKKAGGIDTSDAERTLAAVESGDKDALKAVKAFVQVHLAASDPDFAKTLGVGPGKFSQIGSGGIMNDDTGEVVREPDAKPDKPDYQYDGTHERWLLKPGTGGGLAAAGGGPASGSWPAAGRTIGGWTPRGPNSDAAVDGKISGMTQALGIDPTTPFPPGTSNLTIAKALALSEGGKGTLADRNNNPANLTDPKTGAYRKFPTPEAGLQAAAAQVARNRARGQNTIQTMVEGRPVGGATQAPSAVTSSGPPDVVNVPASGPAADDGSLMGPAFLATLPAGRRNLLTAIAGGHAAPPRPGSKFGEQLSEDLARAFPDVDTTQYATRQATMKGFASGPQGNTVRSLNVAIDHLGVLHDAALALHSGNIPLFNRLSQRWQTATGGPLPANAKAVAGIVSDEVTKAVIGSAGALADRKDLKDTLDTAGSPDQVMGVTRQYISLMAGQAKGLQRQYEQGSGNRDFHRFLSPTTAKVLGLNQTAPVKVASIQQAMSLPKGTVFLTPDGRRKVR